MELFDQPRLFRLAIEDFFTQAHYEIGSGWQLTVGARRQDETWGEAYHERYIQLTTPELLDVVLAALDPLLNSPQQPR